MKKIRYDEAAFILNYQNKHFFKKYLCNWYIGMNNDNEGKIQWDIKGWAFGLLLLPACIVEFFDCLWYWGLRNFELPSRIINSYPLSGLINEGDETTFGRLRIIYARH